MQTGFRSSIFLSATSLHIHACTVQPLDSRLRHCNGTSMVAESNRVSESRGLPTGTQHNGMQDGEKCHFVRLK
jgi:hypothetical protein